MTSIRCLAVVVFAGCGAAPAPTAPTVPIRPPSPAATDDAPRAAPPDPERARLAIAWAATPTDTDAEAEAVWRRVVPTAVDWELRVAQIPDDRVVPLARAVLRRGGFACAPVIAPGCVADAVDLVEPAAAADYDDPCLRRELAFWALGNLGGAAGDLVPELTAIVAAPQTDEELATAVLAAAAELPEAVRMDLYRAARGAGHRGAVDASLGELSEAAMTAAATQLHIDAAIFALDATMSRPVFLAAIADRELRPITRVDAIEELVGTTLDAPPRDLVAALTAATRDPDCEVAAAAAIALVRFGKPDALPRRPRSRKVGEAMRALCVLAAADSAAGIAGFIGPAGLKVIDRAFEPDREFIPDDDDADGDHDPRTVRTVETIARADLVDVPFAGELANALASCSGTTCLVSPGVEITLGLVPAKDGGLWLDAIERHDRGDCGPR